MRGELVDPVLTASAKSHTRSMVGEQTDRRCADAKACARHDGFSAGEVKIDHVASPDVVGSLSVLPVVAG